MAVLLRACLMAVTAAWAAIAAPAPTAAVRPIRSALKRCLGTQWTLQTGIDGLLPSWPISPEMLESQVTAIKEPAIKELGMARYKPVDMSPRLLAVDLEAQLVPGTFVQ